MNYSRQTFVTVLTFCLSICSVRGAGDESKQSVSACVKAAEQAIKESGLLKGQTEFRLTNDNNSVTLSYHTREWLVYSAGKDGIWSTEPRKQIGPDSDGIIITVGFTLIDNSPVEPFTNGNFGGGISDLEQWDGRYPKLDLKGLDIAEERPDIISPLVRRPYWKVYGCGAVTSDRRVWVRVSVAINNRTNRKLLEQAFAPIATAFAKDK